MSSDLFVLHCGGYAGLEVSELKGSLEATGTKYALKPAIANISRIASDEEGAISAAKRLSLSFFICQELVFSRGDSDDILEEIRKGIVESHVESLKVRVIRSRAAIPPDEALKLERTIGEVLSSRMQASINLRKPEAEFILFVSRQGFIFGRKLEETARRALRPRTNKMKQFRHPSTLQPDLSRALVNMARVRPGDLAIDPYCGVGGILLEIAEVGATAIGLDFKEGMVRGAKRNLLYYGHVKWHVIRGDARNPPFFRTDRIVTDPPYGRLSPRIRGTTIEELNDSLVGFSAEALPTGGYVSLICPSDIPVQTKLRREGFEILSSNELRVHGSLTRLFVSARRN